MNTGKAETYGESKTISWYTPRWIMDKLGHFDLDPCGTPRWPCADLTYESEGLERPWDGRVWLNPPYGKGVYAWLEKLKRHGNGVALVFVRTDALWFQNIASSLNWILLIKGRVKFIQSDSLVESSNTPGAPSMLMAFGDQPKPDLPGVFATINGLSNPE